MPRQCWRIVREAHLSPPSCAAIAQAGVERLSKLRVLYLSNNKLKDWSELDRLAGLASLEDLLLVGNPLYVEQSKDTAMIAAYRIEVGRWLRCAVLCCAVLCCAVLCCAVLLRVAYCGVQVQRLAGGVRD